VNPFKPTEALADGHHESRRLRFATYSRGKAWLAVTMSFLVLGSAMYSPQLAKTYLHDQAIAASIFTLFALSLSISICVFAFASRFAVARVFNAISVLMNVGLVVILGFIYWVLNYSGIEFPGPG
jgi:hypothetical protein